MIEIVEYAGHRIRVSAVLGNDGWTWSYSIDDGPIRFSRYGPLRYQDMALTEAVAAARAEVDIDAIGR